MRIDLRLQIAVNYYEGDVRVRTATPRARVGTQMYGSACTGDHGEA